jgi:AcrR family transcriptional regulator
MAVKAPNTELKIKEAARKIFTEKGFAATRTRDIAEAAGINLALLNYYFRSKDNLFQIIMIESLELFIQDVINIINNSDTSLETKVELLAEHYINMLMANPGLPTFVLNTVNANPSVLFDRINLGPDIQETAIAGQWRELAAKGTFSFNPLHILLNMVGLTVFPFAARPVIKLKMGLTDDQFNVLMEERKKLIPVWIKGMLEGMLLKK